MTNNPWDPTGPSYDDDAARAQAGPAGDPWAAPAPAAGSSPVPATFTPPSEPAPQPGYAPRPEYGTDPAGEGTPSYASQQAPYAAGGFQPYYAQATRDTSGATTLLVVGCVLTVVCCVFAGLPGIICGAMAMSSGRDQESIDRVVRTGWIITAVVAAVTVLLFLLYFGAIFAMLGLAGSGTTSGMALGGR